MVTMDQVAARAKVSQATVSHVLGGKADQNKISQQTRDRVLEVAQELGYHRNLIARSMVTGKNRTLAVLIPLPANENMVQIITGALEAANENDYFLKIMQLNHDKDNIATINRCFEWRLDGAMVFGMLDRALRDLHDEFHRMRFPLALVDSVLQTEWGVRCVSDDAMGIRQVVEHLLGLGHRRIAFLGGRDSSINNWRETSFREAIADAGLSLPEHWVQKSSWGNAGVIAESVKELLRDDRPTAVVGASDIIAFGVTNVARAMGLRLPADLSITGYSNAELSAYLDPALTTVDQSFQAIGYAAVLHLIKRAESGELNPTLGQQPEIILPTRLVVRSSTAPPSR